MDKLDLVTKHLTVDEDGAIRGIAWPYAAPDSAGDIIKKGALRLPVAELPMLRNHDTDAVIGLWSIFDERDDGLHVEGRLDLKSMQARATRAQILTGRLTETTVHAWPEDRIGERINPFASTPMSRQQRRAFERQTGRIAA